MDGQCDTVLEEDSTVASILLFCRTKSHVCADMEGTPESTVHVDVAEQIETSDSKGRVIEAPECQYLVLIHEKLAHCLND